jgi:hypothetical protein
MKLSFLGVAFSLVAFSILIYFIVTNYTFVNYLSHESKLLLRAWNVSKNAEGFTLVFIFLYQISKCGNLKKFMDIMEKVDEDVSENFLGCFTHQEDRFLVEIIGHQDRPQRTQKIYLDSDFLDHLGSVDHHFIFANRADFWWICWLNLISSQYSILLLSLDQASFLLAVCICSSCD